MLEAFHALHKKAGMEHDNYAESSGHILYDPKKKKAFIIDFTRAFPGHECGLRLDFREEYAGIVPDPVFGCRELLWISRMVGMTKSAGCMY